MPRRIAPIPVQTAMVQKDGMLSQTWQIWMRTLGQNGVESTALNRSTDPGNTTGLDWLASGGVVFVHYDGEGGVDASLPFVPVFPALLLVNADGVTSSLSASQSFTIPDGNSVHLSGWYFADLSKTTGGT